MSEYIVYVRIVTPDGDVLAGNVVIDELDDNTSTVDVLSSNSHLLIDRIITSVRDKEREK